MFQVFGERLPVSPVRNFGVAVMTAEGVPVYEGPGVAASRAEEREKDIFTKSEKWLPAMPLQLARGTLNVHRVGRALEHEEGQGIERL